MPGLLAGKVAVVTGASRGLGRAIALAYAVEGASVVLAARPSADLKATTQDADALSFAMAVATDVREEGDCVRLAQQVNQAFGRLDILVNNAGIFVPSMGGSSVLDVEPKGWDDVFATNVRGVYLVTRALLPTMRRGDGGSIINVSSGLAQRVVPGTGPYAASKSAVETLTRVLAEELREKRIRVNALHPGGIVDTAFIPASVPGEARKRMLRPPVICPAAVWLASGESADVTGQVVNAREWNEERGIRIGLPEDSPGT